MAMQHALLVMMGLWLCWLQPGASCNGDPAFCDLPLGSFTFPGTHNSGAFSLGDIPEIIPDDIPGVTVNNVLRCMFENHDMNFVQQLNFGIRSFNVDFCNHAASPDVLFNCHGVKEDQTAWGGDFASDLAEIRAWMGLHQQEVVLMWPGNLHFQNVSSRAAHWREYFSRHFGATCVEINELTDISSWSRSSDVSCALVTGPPNENVTLGQLSAKNVRFLVMKYDWDPSIAFSTYHETIQPGATSQLLLDDFVAYAVGRKPLYPNTNFVLEVFGSAKIPDFTLYHRCADPICKAAALKLILEDLELRCVHDLSTNYNTDLLQDDTNEHVFSSGETCPEYSCGCLGYQSPLEVVHQKLLAQGHSVQVVQADYPEKGTKTQLSQVTRRMNEATLRHMRGEPELGASWWSCHWQPVTAVGVPLLLLACCGVYVALACRYPKRWGTWFWRYLEGWRRNRAAAERGAQRGREEARRYLAAERGDFHSAGPGVAPPPMQVPPNGPMGYQNQFQKFTATE